MKRWSTCAAVVLAALVFASCAAPERRPTPAAPLSFDVMIAGVPGWGAVGSANAIPPDNRHGFAEAGIPGGCCPTCEAITLSVRNVGDAAVAIDWSQARMEHNGSKVDLVVEGAKEGALSAVAPGSTWTGTLRPQPGAPNASALEEGKFRNGRYSVHLLVHQGDAVSRASTDVTIAYGPEQARDASCASQ